MSCEKRMRTGSCGHQQCPHPNASGYQCVTIVAGYCEVGQGCVEKCDFSWKDDDKETTYKAIEAFRQWCGDDKEVASEKITESPKVEPVIFGKTMRVVAPRGANKAREIVVLGHRDPRGPDNNILVWVDENDKLHIRVLKADRCYRFEQMIDTPAFVEIVQA